MGYFTLKYRYAKIKEKGEVLISEREAKGSIV
jgi:hypothetical protein